MSFAALLVLLAPGPATSQPPEAPPTTGDAVIRGPAGPSEIVITTRSRVAGAIDSLTWGGREFIDSFDHGRQLQSASNFDGGGRFVPETFNPTEAGSRADGRGPTSTWRGRRSSAARAGTTCRSRAVPATACG